MRPRVSTGSSNNGAVTTNDNQHALPNNPVTIKRTTSLPNLNTYVPTVPFKPDAPFKPKTPPLSPSQSRALLPLLLKPELNSSLQTHETLIKEIADTVAKKLKRTDVNERVRITVEHVIRDTTEFLAKIPKDKKNIVVHYDNDLFKAMLYVALESKKSGYSPESVLHSRLNKRSQKRNQIKKLKLNVESLLEECKALNDPYDSGSGSESPHSNSSDESKANAKTKPSFNLKGASVYVPICHGTKEVMTGPRLDRSIELLNERNVKAIQFYHPKYDDIHTEPAKFKEVGATELLVWKKANKELYKADGKYEKFEDTKQSEQDHDQLAKTQEYKAAEKVIFNLLKKEEFRNLIIKDSFGFLDRNLPSLDEPKAELTSENKRQNPSKQPSAHNDQKDHQNKPSQAPVLGLFADHLIRTTLPSKDPSVFAKCLKHLKSLCGSDPSLLDLTISTITMFALSVSESGTGDIVEANTNKLVKALADDPILQSGAQKLSKTPYSIFNNKESPKVQEPAKNVKPKTIKVSA